MKFITTILATSLIHAKKCPPGTFDYLVGTFEAKHPKLVNTCENEMQEDEFSNTKEQHTMDLCTSCSCHRLYTAMEKTFPTDCEYDHKNGALGEAMATFAKCTLPESCTI